MTDKPPFSADQLFHVYNHANGGELLFQKEYNYRYFMLLFQKHMEPVVNLAAFCLMPNHFHFLVKTRTLEEIKNVAKIQDLILEDVPEFVSKQWSNYFNAYAKAFNRMYHRRGSLFERGVKRKIANDLEYAQEIVRYIHLNPVKDRFCETPDEWKHSSYTEIINQEFRNVDEGLLWEIFPEMEEFVIIHKRKPVRS